MKKLTAILSILVLSSTAFAGNVYNGGGFFGKLVDGGDCYVYLSTMQTVVAIKTNSSSLYWERQKSNFSDFAQVKWSPSGVPGIQTYEVEKDIFNTTIERKIRVSANINQEGRVVEASFKLGTLFKTFRCVNMYPDPNPRPIDGKSDAVFRDY